MRRTCVIAVAIALGMTDGGNAQRPGRYRAYSDRLVIHVDSAIRVASVQQRLVRSWLEQEEAGTFSEANFDQAATVLARMADAFRRKADDVDAIVPPEDMSAIHRQLVGAIARIATSTDSLSLSYALSSCSSATRSGLGCNGPRRRMNGLAVLGRAVIAQQRATTDLLNARVRAREALAQHHVTMPQPPQSSAAPPQSSAAPLGLRSPPGGPVVDVPRSPAVPSEITGRVVDESTGSAIEAADVAVSSTSIRAFTTASGEFRIRRPADEFTLEVRAMGYVPASVDVSLRSGATDTVLVVRMRRF